MKSEKDQGFGTQVPNLIKNLDEFKWKLLNTFLDEKKKDSEKQGVSEFL